jgi:hypothetical protein
LAAFSLKPDFCGRQTREMPVSGGSLDTAMKLGLKFGHQEAINL